MERKRGGKEDLCLQREVRREGTANQAVHGRLEVSGQRGEEKKLFAESNRGGLEGLEQKATRRVARELEKLWRGEKVEARGGAPAHFFLLSFVVYMDG